MHDLDAELGERGQRVGGHVVLGGRARRGEMLDQSLDGVVATACGFNQTLVLAGAQAPGTLQPVDDEIDGSPATVA